MTLLASIYSINNIWAFIWKMNWTFVKISEIYDQTFNNSFHEKFELIQYNAALAITGAIRSSSREKLYQELGFESLQQQHNLFQNNKKPIPRYLFELILTARQVYMTRNKNSIPLFNVKHNYFNFFSSLQL